MLVEPVNLVHFRSVLFFVTAMGDAPQDWQSGLHQAANDCSHIGPPVEWIPPAGSYYINRHPTLDLGVFTGGRPRDHMSRRGVRYIHPLIDGYRRPGVQEFDRDWQVVRPAKLWRLGSNYKLQRLHTDRRQCFDLTQRQAAEVQVGLSRILGVASKRQVILCIDPARDHAHGLFGYNAATHKGIDSLDFPNTLRSHEV